VCLGAELPRRGPHSCDIRAQITYNGDSNFSLSLSADKLGPTLNDTER